MTNISTTPHEQLCGYVPNAAASEAFTSSLPQPVFAGAAADLMQQSPRDTLLYEALLKLHPGWQRGTQGIGDCVSWGYELGCTLLQAVQIVLLNQPELWRGEFATESIYGGSRVEVNGGRSPLRGDGSLGAWAAKWVRDWGLLWRLDYSSQTGTPEHDLRTYSARKARDWGASGNGGRSDGGKLDQVAREHPVQSVSMVASFAEAAAAIQNGYPVPVCSMQGFSSQRDRDGFCRPQGTWAHCMCFIGVRYGRRPGLLCTNSWGRSVSGPMWPEACPAAVAACSWWVDAEVCTRMLRGRDSYALSNFKGFPARELNFTEAAQSWN